MFTPVALRFVTYSIPVSRQSQEFIHAVCISISVQKWIEAARSEPEAIDFIDKLIPAAETPLTLG